MTNTILDEGFLHRDAICVKLIRKYAVLLSCFLLLEVVFNMLLPILVERSFSLEQITIRQNITWRVLLYVPSYLMNVITAGIVYQDMKKTSSVSWAIIVAACLYNELGVCFFLITVMYTELQAMIARK